MIDANQCRDQLVSLLTQQIDCTATTNSYLTTLRQAIAENRLADLGDAISKPQDGMQKTEALEQERRALMESYGFATDRAGLEHCITWCDDAAGTLQALHQQLLKELVDLYRSLQVSNLLLNKGKQRIERALDVLTLQPARTKTYTASGTTQSSNNMKRSISRA